MRKKTGVFLLSATMVMTSFTATAFGAETARTQEEESRFVSENDEQTEGSGVMDDDDEQEEDYSQVSISEIQLPCYYFDLDQSVDMPLYFVDEAEDLPYVNLSDWANLLATCYMTYGYDGYELALETDGPVVQFTRENGTSLLFDFEDQTIIFEDYDEFCHLPDDNSLIDMVASDSVDDNGNPVLLNRIEKGSFDRHGREITLDLGSYQIPMCWSEENNLYLVPLQTMSDFLCAVPMGINAYYNGEGVYLASTLDLGVENEELTPLGESYFSAPYGDMSEELAWYSYCELCLALDNLYGLKEIHDITSFDSIFRETGYTYDLSSTDPNVKDGALKDFIYYYLDDLHSGFECASYRTEMVMDIGGAGQSARQDIRIRDLFTEARNHADHTIQSYEEVGNTAYVTFDGFSMRKDYPSDYYEESPEPDTDPASPELDTISLILYAQQQICREDSPIENVVIDLSLNGGGELDAAAFVAAWFLGEASMNIRNSMTGAISAGTYKADTNLDGQYDEKDLPGNRKLFCLIGPYSFSAGNLVPNIFKSSNTVTLIGQKSGGGSCSVLTMNTAYGSIFRVSSPRRMSYLKNGSFYDIDTGIDPDCYIMQPENFYDREALTEYINNLF